MRAQEMGGGQSGGMRWLWDEMRLERNEMTTGLQRFRDEHVCRERVGFEDKVDQTGV